MVMGVEEDKAREVLGIFNRPSESATGMGEMFAILKERGIKKRVIGCRRAKVFGGITLACISGHPTAKMRYTS